MRWGAIAVCTSLAGCTFGPARSLVSEPLPDEVEYTALLLQDEGGRLLESTALVRREPGEPIGVPIPEAIEDASFVHLLGFRSADLEQLGFEPSDADARVTIAAPVEPLLPEPSWYGKSRIYSGSGTIERANDPPFVTAAWLPECASLVEGESRLVDSNCHSRFCALVAEQSGCAFAITAEDTQCAPERIEGRIDGAGELLVPGCTPVAAHAGASAAVECSDIRSFDCEIEIHAEPEAPRLSVQSVALYADVPPPQLDELSAVAIGGVLFGLEVFEDRIVVASDAGRVAWSAGCPSAVPGIFHFLDPETLETVGTADAPPCVRELARVPDRDELFAIYGPENARALGRFAKDGTLLESAAIPERPAVESPFALEVHRLSDRVSIALAAAEGVQYHTFVRSPALAHEWSSPVLPDFADQQEVEENVIAILDRKDDLIHAIDPTKPAADPRSPPFPSNTGPTIRFREVCEDVQVRPERMLFVPGEGWLMASRNDVTGLIARLSLDATDCELVRWFEGPSEVFDLTLWPADPDLVLAGVRNRTDGRAHLSLMSRTEGRFFTGSVAIGTGAIDDMRSDPRGRVYLTLPWSGSVARVEMR